jgi:hypothetical protein
MASLPLQYPPFSSTSASLGGQHHSSIRHIQTGSRLPTIAMNSALSPAYTIEWGRQDSDSDSRATGTLEL